LDSILKERSLSCLDNGSLPQISVVIPTLNEVNYLGDVLQSIVNNSIPLSNMEVLLIDGGSIDGTVKVAQRFSDQLQLQIIEAPGSSVYRALNIGLNAARGKYFVRVDARSLIPRSYIKTCIDHLNRPYVGCAGGKQRQVGESKVGEAVAWVTSSKFGTGGAKFRSGSQSGFVDTVYLGVFRTATLREMGGFEDGEDYMSEDALINSRLRDRGWKIYLDAQLEVAYPAKASFRALAKQYLIYGAAKAALVRKFHRFTSLRQVVPLLFLYSSLVLWILALFGVLSWVFLIMASMAYVLMVGVACSSIFNSVGQPTGRFWARCLATCCIHFSDPIGFSLFLINQRLHKRFVRWM
jgi:glycosyltransferase involved in cell wall biosynthesis